jgi:RNA-splicing ligase RtcB
LGKELAEHYQKEAWTGLKNHNSHIPRDLAYLTGTLYKDYLNDMKLTQQFALINRKAMMSVLLHELGIDSKDIHEQFTTIHNYIDTDTMILRKGAVSANIGEKLLIPINMRDGSLLCEGLGNPDWNFSAPHGAGRLMSRTKAFATLNMVDFQKSMKGIYSTSVNTKTLDESPMCYKDMNEIIQNIQPTVVVLKKIKPIYNFKAAE